MPDCPSCSTCIRYQVGTREVLGYVLCGWDSIDIDIAAPREIEGRPRTLQRPTLGQVWIRIDAAIIEACGAYRSSDPCLPCERTPKMAPGDTREHVRERVRRYRERQRGLPVLRCPICGRQMSERTATGEPREVCERKACQMRLNRESRPGATLIGGSEAGARGG